MKLVYDNIVVGTVKENSCDMYRVGAFLELTPIHERESSKLSDELFKYIQLKIRNEELEAELGEYNAIEDSEVNKLWEQLVDLPSFEGHDCWKLLNEKTGATESISTPIFSDGGVGYYISLPESKKEDTKDYSAVIGFIIGVIIVLIYFTWKYY